MWFFVSPRRSARLLATDNITVDVPREERWYPLLPSSATDSSDEQTGPALLGWKHPWDH